MNNITIAVDAMGGDIGPPVVIPAALQVLSEYDMLHLILVGNSDLLQKQLSQHNNFDQSRLTIQHASQQVEMNELAWKALRTKKDSSMRVAIDLVKDGKAKACVSAGNTGALMVIGRFVLKTIPGIDRPAIVSTFPTFLDKKNVRMLDLGANIDSTPENLFQFAVMGSVLTSAIDNIKNPKICLLNIGKEENKGTESIKEAAQLLANSKIINYGGYIEGNQIYKGLADVIVCDGFIGNIALKTTEGTAHFIGKLIKKAYSRNIFTKIIGLISLPILKTVTNYINPNRYNGATLLGLQGIIVKSHGGAKQQAFANAIVEALKQVEKNVPERISAEVQQLLALSKTNDNTHS